MTWLRIGVSGAFGGAAPSLLELAGLARREELPGLGYAVAVAIFALLGAGVALIHKEDLPHKAFFLGVAAPALIVAASAVTDRPPSWPDGGIESPVASNALLDAFRLSVIAYADPPQAEIAVGEQPPIADAVLASFQVRLSLDEPAAREVRALYFVAHGVAVEAPSFVEARTDTGSKRVVWNLPTDADAVFVVGESFKSPLVSLPHAAKPVDLHVERKATFWSGLYAAFGQENRAKALQTTALRLEPTEVRNVQ